MVPVSGQDGARESAHDAVDNILNTMEVSITPMNEEFTTITDSAKTCEYKIIPNDYFILKSQSINAVMKSNNPDWEDIRNKVQVHIDSELKDRMLKEAQKVGLYFGKLDRKCLLENFSEIGNLWETDGSVENALKINQVIYGVFDASQGYE